MGDPAGGVPEIFQGMGVGELARALAALPGDTVIFVDIGTLPDPIMSYAIFARDILQLRDPALPEREEILKVKNDGLRVRSTPEIKDSNIVATLKAGTTLTAKGHVLAGGYTWVKISAGPYTGMYAARTNGSQVFLTS
jgi:hypothetical protein